MDGRTERQTDKLEYRHVYKLMDEQIRQTGTMQADG